MKLQHVTLLLLSMVLFSCGKPSANNSVDEVIALFENSVNQKELTPLNEVFSSKAKIYEQGSVDESWEKYRDGHLGKEINEMANMEFSFDIKETIEGMDMALVRGNYLIEGEMHGSQISSAGLATLSLTIEDGLWKIVHLQFSRGCKKSASAHDHSNHKNETTAKPKAKSPKTAAMANIGDAHIHIDYSSPRVRGREIWGGLIAYDEVWATGAHRATAINFPKDVIINDTKVPAGKYGFFTIPGKETWTLIINKNWDQHMSDDYDPADDVVRITVTPEKLTENQEELLYTVTETGNNKGEIAMSWEKLRVSFTVEVME